MVQMVPLLWAVRQSSRVLAVDAQSWSLHPLAISELFVAQLFGRPDAGLPETMPWLIGLHGREPLFFSLYVGLGLFALALISPRDPAMRRRRRFWWAVAAVALISALGVYTPLYPAMQSAVPVLQSFRYPVKYLAFVVLALAALATMGADALLAHARTRQSMARPVLPMTVIGAVVVASAAIVVATVASPGWMRSVWEATAILVEIDTPAKAAASIVEPAKMLFIGVGLLGAGMTMLMSVVWKGGRAAPLAAMALCGLAVADPLVVNRGLHPTMPASALGAPAWMLPSLRHHADRVYVGGTVGRTTDSRVGRNNLVDAPDSFSGDAELPVYEGNALLGAQLVHHPAAWGLRQSISPDLPRLWSREYSMMVARFVRVPREARLRFLSRTGVRYCYLPEPPQPGIEPLTSPVAATHSMVLYECEPDPRRVYVTSDATVEPNLRTQIDLMFDAAHDPYSRVLLERDPPAEAGRRGIAAAPHARILRERNTELVVRTSVGPGGGYLNVVDSYDPFWIVDVGGEPATLLRANGLYRAVRLAPGTHDVRFTFRPMPFYQGLAISLAAALLLLAACVREWLRGRNKVASG
jgi:hypothetical protein